MALRGIAICYYSHPSLKQEDSLNWIVTLNQKRYFGNSVRLISTNQTKSNHSFIRIAFCYCHLDAQFRYGSCPKRRCRAPMDSVSFTCLPMILRKQSDSNAYCVLDSVFNLGLQGLFQAEISNWQNSHSAFSGAVLYCYLFSFLLSRGTGGGMGRLKLTLAPCNKKYLARSVSITSDGIFTATTSD